MKYLKTLSLLLISVFVALGQNDEEVKALLERIEAEENDSLTVDLYVQVGKLLEGKDIITYNVYFDPAISLAQEIRYEKGIVDLIYRKANNLHFWAKKEDHSSKQLMAAGYLFDSVYRISKRLKYDLGLSYGLNGLGRTQQELKNYDSALVYYHQDLELCQKENDSIGAMIAAYNVAESYFYLRNYPRAIQYHLIEREYFGQESRLIDRMDFHNQISRIYFSLRNYEKSLAHLDTLEILLEKSDSFKYAANYYLSAGLRYYKHGLYASALDSFEKSYKIASKENNKEKMSSSLFWVAEIYFSQNIYTKAIDYYRRSLAIHEGGELWYIKGETYFMIAEVYLLANQLDSAQYYYNIVLSEIVENNEKQTQDQRLLTEAYTRLFKARLLLNSNQIDSALVIAEQVHNLILSKAELFNDFHLIYDVLGKIYFKKLMFDESIQAYNAVLKMESKLNTPILLLESLEGISNNYKTLGDFENALKYHTRFIELRDSLQNDYNSQRLAKLEFDAFQEKLHAEHSAQLAEEEKSRIIVIIVSGLLFTILVILYFFYHSKAKANRTLKTLNSEINYQKEELEFLNKEKNKLIGVVAHDLRSPLNSVKGLVNIFKIEDDEKEKERYLDLITVSTERMTDMVNRVLDVSAIESKKLDLRSEKVDLVDLTNQLMVNFQFSAEKKKQKIVFDSQIHKAIVELDKNYLIQVIENLVSNALKYSEKETTTTLALEKKDDRVRLSVLDQGPGIGEEEQKKLFQEFSTLTSKTTGGEKATGLGLSIVKKYVEAMKGRIWCESELGQGSSFSIEFAMWPA